MKCYSFASVSSLPPQRSDVVTTHILVVCLRENILKYLLNSHWGKE